jgi:hypothetical protein
VIAGFREFEFDLPDALLKSLITAFEGMESAPLDPDDVQAIPDEQGVYQLLLNDEIVYIGKTDGGAGLRSRLTRHAWTIQHRNNLSVGDVSFKAVRVFVFTALDLETDLIQHYRGRTARVWNNSGFGSNDPGRNRDFTRTSEASFDVLYPIDLDVPIDLAPAGTVSVREVIASLRSVLPYTFRVESSGAHVDFEGRSVEIENPITAREAIGGIVSSLPPGWQATALAGRIVLYKEFREDYPDDRVIARS